MYITPTEVVIAVTTGSSDTFSRRKVPGALIREREDVGNRPIHEQPQADDRHNQLSRAQVEDEVHPPAVLEGPHSVWRLRSRSRQSGRSPRRRS